MEDSDTTGRSTRFLNRRVILIWILAALAILPVLFKWSVPSPATGLQLDLRMGFVYSAAAIICYVIYRREAGSLSRGQRMSLILLVFLITSVLNQIHGFYVDQSSTYFGSTSNAAWQATLNDSVVHLSPMVLPHSYRFLPNSIVRWLQLGGWDYDSARDSYRLIFGLLLFYAVYKYAHLYTNHLGALLAMLLVALIYPVSFERYAGQLTDPMSHLSFVLAFIFLETGEFFYLLSTLLIGSLAKETVLAMTGFYILFCRNEERYVLKATALSIASVVAYVGVRLIVLKGHMNYLHISGVPPGFVRTNWNDETWPPLFLLTACVFLPFLALGWKTTPLFLKRLVFFLFPVLFLSSLGFSWLHEARNFMPLVFVSAVIAARYIVDQTVAINAGKEDQQRDQSWHI